MAYSSKRPRDPSIALIVVRRPRSNVVEWSVYRVAPDGSERIETLHANRSATFFGRHTGGPGMQIGGGAWTPWRRDDAHMLAAFQRAYGRVECRLD